MQKESWRVRELLFYVTDEERTISVTELNLLYSSNGYYSEALNVYLEAIKTNYQKEFKI